MSTAGLFILTMLLAFAMANNSQDEYVEQVTPENDLDQDSSMLNVVPEQNDIEDNGSRQSKIIVKLHFLFMVKFIENF